MSNAAGLTMFSAVNKTNTRKGDFLIITGAGGGLGHLCVQLYFCSLDMTLA